MIHLTARSPVYAHTNTTVNGLSTVRAYRAVQMVKNEFDALQDAHTSAYFICCASSRAFALWLEMICIFYLASTISIFLLLGKGDNSQLLAFSIANCILINRFDRGECWTCNHSDFQYDHDGSMGNETNGRTGKLDDIC